MKKIFIVTIAVFCTLLLTTNTTFAQTQNTTQELTMGIPEVLLIKAVDETGQVAAVDLQLTTTNAGTKIEGGTGTSYLQASSIVPDSKTRTIQAKYASLPAGTTLTLTGATPTSGNQDGTFGTSSGAVQLSTTDQDIFTGIGSCYTGTAATDGYVLDWSWNANTGSYADIVSQSGTSTTVTFTITAAQ